MLESLKIVIEHSGRRYTIPGKLVFAVGVSAVIIEVLYFTL